ncbi:MAG: lyase family protein, partial [Pseudomonadota bacterium]
MPVARDHLSRNRLWHEAHLVADMLFDGWVDIGKGSNRAHEHKDTVRIGRSHGIHAEPTTMGLTFARFYAEMDRNRSRLRDARMEIATGAISGA